MRGRMVLMTGESTREEPIAVWWLCDGCEFPYLGKPAQVVDVYDGIETYCDDCSEAKT